MTYKEYAAYANSAIGKQVSPQAQETKPSFKVRFFKTELDGNKNCKILAALEQTSQCAMGGVFLTKNLLHIES